MNALERERAYLRDCQAWLSDVRRFGWRDQWAELCVLDALDRVWEAQEANQAEQPAWPWWAFA